MHLRVTRLGGLAGQPGTMTTTTRRADSNPVQAAARAQVQDNLAGVQGGDPAAIGEQMARFVVGILEDADADAGSRMIGLIRAAAAGPEAAVMVRDLLTGELWARGTELHADGQPKLRISLMASDLIGLMMARYLIGAEPLASLPPDAVVACIAPVLQRSGRADPAGIQLPPSRTSLGWRPPQAGPGPDAKEGAKR